MRATIVFLVGLVCGAILALSVLPRGTREKGSPEPPNRALRETPVKPPTPPPASPATPPRDPLPTARRPIEAERAVGVVDGRVLDSWGKPIPGAHVAFRFARRALDPDGEVEIAFDAADTVLHFPEAEGRFRVELETGGILQVEASAPGYESASTVRTLPPPPFKEGVFFTLRPDDLHLAWIRGRVVNPRGEALPPEDLRFLFPVGNSGEEDVPEFSSHSGIHAVTPPFLGQEGPYSTIDRETGNFEMPVRPGWEGIVVLVFRETRIAEVPWRDGDPEIEFRVDVSVLRGTLGELEARVIDGETLAAVEGARVSVERRGFFVGEGRSTSSRTPAGGVLRWTGLPQGLYTLVASAPERAPAALEATVTGGGATPVEMRLQKPTSVRLRLVAVEGWRPKPGECGVNYVDRDGRILDSSSEAETEGGETFVRVWGVPPGEGHIVLYGNVLPVRLDIGENPVLDFPVRRKRTVDIRAWVPVGRRPASPRGLAGHLRLLFEGRVPVSEGTWYPSLPSEGRVTFQTFAPPGPYTLVLDFGTGTPVRREILVGAGETTGFVVP